MTKFRKDFIEAVNGNGIEVITRRRNELKKLIAEGKSCKNRFRMQCIAQEVVKLQQELEAIENAF